MSKTLGGVLGPVTSPFGRSDGELAPERLVSNIETLLAAGLNGVLLAGSNGEAALLDDEERHLLAETARRVVPSDRWLLMGVGSESTRLTVRRAREAAARGVDAVVVVSPHYYTASMTTAALRGHFRRVADASPVPVVLYNIPKYAHFALAPELVADLAAHGNVIGVKDSSGDMALLGAYLAAQSTRFTVLTGSGPMMLAGLEAGARGGILGVSLFASGPAMDVYRAHERGDREAAKAAHDRILAPAREIVNGLGPAGVKAALDAVGLYGGSVRSPLIDLEPAAVGRVRALLDDMAAVPAT